MLFASVVLSLLLVQRLQNNIRFPEHQSSSPVNWVSSYRVWFDPQHPDGSEANLATCLLSTEGCFQRGKSVQGMRLRMSGASLLAHAWECTSYYAAQGRHITRDSLVSYDGVLWDVMPCSLIDMYQDSKMNPFISLHSSTLMMNG